MNLNWGKIDYGERPICNNGRPHTTQILAVQRPGDKRKELEDGSRLMQQPFVQSVLGNRTLTVLLSCKR